MKVSLKWLAELVDLSKLDGPSAIAELLTRRGLEVEAIERQDAGFDKVVTAQILERAPHPQADRLSLCKVTLGSGDPLEIVCGAQNMKAGDRVALAQIGAELPNGLKIAQSKIRGSTSNGMLCSEQELGLLGPDEESPGILILPTDTKLGLPLAQVLGRDDTVLTLKLTANRADCLGHWGIARELASALGVKPKAPQAATLALGDAGVAVRLEAAELAPQLAACQVRGVRVGPSPDWVVRRLQALGARSINNVVDATNLVLWETGHPVHAYDFERLRDATLGVRSSKAGEKLPLLDGSEVALTGQELVIADGKGLDRAVGLAGVMGGGNSEVETGTVNLLLECAEFAPGSVRRTATRFLKRTEASHRFERGVDSEGLASVMSRLAKLVVELAGGTAGPMQLQQEPSRKKVVRSRIAVRSKYFEEFLGFPVSAQEARQVLESLDCSLSENSQGWEVTPPSYRLDLKLKQDLAEEIARCLGYDRIPESLPALSSDPSFVGSSRDALGVQSRAKAALVRMGLCETVNFAFSSQKWLAAFGLESQAKVANPLSEEHEALVPSLLPGLFKNTVDNGNRHFGSEALTVRLFELRPTYRVDGAAVAKGQMETNVVETWKLAFCLAGPRYASALRAENPEIDFSDVKAVVEGLFEELGTKGLRFIPLHESRTPASPQTALFHPGQSFEVLAGNQSAGWVGMVHPGIARQHKLKGAMGWAELDWAALAKLSRGATQGRVYRAWGEFPGIERDFALVVEESVSAEKILQVAAKVAKPLARSLKVFDVYRGQPVPAGKVSVAVRIVLGDDSRSLQEAEAEGVAAKLIDAWKREVGAELR